MKQILSLLLILLCWSCANDPSEIIIYEYNGMRIIRHNKGKKVLLFDSINIKDLNYSSPDVIIDWRADDAFAFHFLFEERQKILLFSGGGGHIEYLNEKSVFYTPNVYKPNRYRRLKEDTANIPRLYSMINGYNEEVKMNIARGSLIKSTKEIFPR